MRTARSHYVLGLTLFALLMMRHCATRHVGPRDEEIKKHLSNISKLIDVLLDVTNCTDYVTIPEDGSEETPVATPLSPPPDPTSLSSSSSPSPPLDSSSPSPSIAEDPSSSTPSSPLSSTPSPAQGISSPSPDLSPDSSSTLSPDTSTPSPDSSPSPDAPTSTPDSSSTSSPDTSSSTPAPSQDTSSTPSPDSSTPSPDSSTPSPDSSTPSPDSSSPSPDTSSTPSPDASSTPAPSLSPPSQTPPRDCEYSDFTPSHTALLPERPECQIHKDDLSEEEKVQILQLHNELRAKVARGEELQGAPGPQPPAADMRELIWNDELALVAQAWASQCPHGHDDYPQRRICTRDYEVGQNIHYYWGYAPESDWARAVNSWYNEVVDMPKDVAAAFKKQPAVEIGHYTQVVWGSTREVGCGIIYYLAEKNGKVFPASKTYVCNYGGSGNIRNRPLYTEGPAASACPNGTSLTYPDLCL